MGYIWGLNNKKSSGGNNAQVETNKNNIDALTTRVNSLANTTAKTNIANTFTANQNVNGQVKVTSGAEAIVINSTGDKFIAFKNGNTREAYIGRPTQGSQDIELNSGTGNIKLTTSGQKIVSNSNYEQLNGNVKVLDVSLGFGGQAAVIPDEGTNKNLRFSKGNTRFAALDLQNQTKLANVANIKSVTKQNVANGTNVTHNLPGNSIVLMIRCNSNGANFTNWKLLNSGALTITNDTGRTENFIITYWEM